MGIKTLIFIALISQLANAGCPFSSKSKEKPLEIPKDDVADPETTTPNGCTCTSLCGASADDLFRVSFFVNKKQPSIYVRSPIHIPKQDLVLAWACLFYGLTTHSDFIG